MVLSSAEEKTRERNILEITFAKLYGEIEDFHFSQNIFEKLYSHRVISKETYGEIRGKKYDTIWERNR